MKAKRTPAAFTVVIETDAYRIVRSRETRDFDCFVTGAGYIGTRATQSDAEHLIDQYRYDTMQRAPINSIDMVIEKPVEALTEAQVAAGHLANVQGHPAYVVERNGFYYVQDDQDLNCYFTDPEPTIVYTAEPMRRAA